MLIASLFYGVEMCKGCNDTGVMFYAADTGEQVGSPCSCGLPGYNEYIKQKYSKKKYRSCPNPTGLLGIQTLATKDTIFVELNTSLDTTIHDLSLIDLKNTQVRTLFLLKNQ